MSRFGRKITRLQSCSPPSPLGVFSFTRLAPPCRYFSLGKSTQYFQFGWFTIFFWGIFLPLLFVAAHAFLHVKGKTLIIKGPFWKKKKEIELEPNEAKKQISKLNFIKIFFLFARSRVLLRWSASPGKLRWPSCSRSGVRDYNILELKPTKDLLFRYLCRVQMYLLNF